jgi:DNA-binding NarL/FixJ family response regulator
MPRKVITLGIADDMMLDQALIEYNIKAIKNTQILFRSGNGYELLHKLNHFKPDILIIDMYMPLMNGWETIHELNKMGYAGNIICTTAGYEFNLIDRLKQLGVKGFARKHTNHMTKAVKEVSEGLTYYHNEFALYKGDLHKPLETEKVEISGKEIDIINMLANGKSSKEIAQQLGTYTPETIDTYIKNLIDKIQLNNRAHLVSYGHMFGLIYTFDSLKNLPKPKQSESENENENRLAIE